MGYSFSKQFKGIDRKPNKIWRDKGSKFYNRSIKSWVEKNDIDICSHNEGKSVVAEIFFGSIYIYFTKFINMWWIRWYS